MKRSAVMAPCGHSAPLIPWVLPCSGCWGLAGGKTHPNIRAFTTQQAPAPSEGSCLFHAKITAGMGASEGQSRIRAAGLVTKPGCVAQLVFRVDLSL